MTSRGPHRPPLQAADLVFETPGLSPEEIAAATAVLLAASASRPADETDSTDPGLGWRMSARQASMLGTPGPGQWARRFRF